MNITEAARLVAERKDFVCGNVKGNHKKLGPFGTGQMSNSDANDILADRDAPDFYVVYSYATPIAWFANGYWNVPDAGYSMTTKKQKTRLRLYALTPMHG